MTVGTFGNLWPTSEKMGGHFSTRAPLTAVSDRARRAEFVLGLCWTNIVHPGKPQLEVPLAQFAAAGAVRESLIDTRHTE